MVFTENVFYVVQSSKKAKELGEVRTDLPNELVASFFFHSILARPANDENIEGWAACSMTLLKMV